MSRHTENSAFREKLIEHLFIGELLKRSWQCGTCDLQISVPEIDNSGYDIIAEENGVLRHIQLKTSYTFARTAKQKVHTALTLKPSGCVVWIYFDEDDLQLGPFLYFGGEPGGPLPSLDDFQTAKHTKGNALGEKLERPAIRVVPKGQFVIYDTIDELWGALFQPALD